MTTTGKRVCLGAFAGAHGVTGNAKVKAFTEDPANVTAYGPVSTENGERSFDLKFLKNLKADFVIVTSPQIKTREEAEAMKGQRIYVDRGRLPVPDEDEFYLDDLVGLTAVDEMGAPMGIVAAVHNFGADDLIELKDIPGLKGVRLVAFTKINAPAVNIEEKSITILREAIDLGEGEPEPS